MNHINIEEKSLQLALVKASGQLKLPQDKLSYEIIEQKKKILGLFGGKVKIKVWQKKAFPRKEKRSEELTKKFAHKKISQETIDLLQRHCEQICSLICGSKCTVYASNNKEKLVLDIDSDYLSKEFSKSPRLYDAIEHILRKTLYKKVKFLPARIFLDAKKTRLKKELDLIKLAKTLSDKVNADKKSMILTRKNPYERRVIHMALDSDSRVYTKSIGAGAGRKLMILPLDNSSNG